jgi:hypothetical protein
MIVTDENRFDFNRDSSYDGATPYYVASFNTRSGAITLTVDDVTAALGYTPLQSVGNVTIANVTGLQTELDTKQPVGDYSPLIHSHNIADVAGLQSALDGKQASGAYAPLVHTHIIADVTGLQTALDSKQPTGSYLTSITSSNVTTALGYTPTSVTGLIGINTITAFKTGLSLVKADVGLGSVDNTADAAKNVLSATKLTTARTINGVSFNGTGNITINAVDSTARVPTTRAITTTAPLTGGGSLSADLTLAITAATGSVAGSMSAADKAKVDLILSGTYTPTVTGVTNTTTVGAAIGRYLRVGNVVHVTVEIDHTAAALADTTVQVSLPIASNLGVTGDLAGTGACNDAAGGASGPIYAAFVAEAANYRFKAVAITSRKHYLTLTYTII